MENDHTQPNLPQHEFEVVAMNNYSQRTTEDLSFTEGEMLTVLDTSDSDWWLARNQKG